MVTFWKLARGGYWAMAAVFLIAGLNCLLCPALSPETLYLFGSVILIAYGIIKLFGYFSRDVYCLAFEYDLACGIFLIALGGIALGCGTPAMTAIPYHLSLGLGLLILMDGLLGIQMSKDARDFGLETWRFLLFSSFAVSAFSALSLIHFFRLSSPSSVLSGIALLAECVKHLCVAFCAIQMELPSSRQNKFD